MSLGTPRSSVPSLQAMSSHTSPAFGLTSDTTSATSSCSVWVMEAFMPLRYQ